MILFQPSQIFVDSQLQNFHFVILQPRYMHLTLKFHPLPPNKSVLQNSQILLLSFLQYWLVANGCLLKELSTAHIAGILGCSPCWRKNQQGRPTDERSSTRDNLYISIAFTWTFTSIWRNYWLWENAKHC